MSDPKKWDSLIIVWEDAMISHSPSNSKYYVKHYKPVIRRSIGFLLGRTDDHIHISSTDDRLSSDYDDAEDITTIPMSMVRSVILLTPSEIL